jgi:hypothetical protein
MGKNGGLDLPKYPQRDCDPFVDMVLGSWATQKVLHEQSLHNLENLLWYIPGLNVFHLPMCRRHHCEQEIVQNLIQGCEAWAQANGKVSDEFITIKFYVILMFVYCNAITCVGIHLLTVFRFCIAIYCNILQYMLLSMFGSLRSCGPSALNYAYETSSTVDTVCQ